MTLVEEVTIVPRVPRPRRTTLDGRIDSLWRQCASFGISDGEKQKIIAPALLKLLEGKTGKEYACMRIIASNIARGLPLTDEQKADLLLV